MSGARALTPAAARIKRVVRQVVLHQLGGVDGAAATTGKGRSTTGRWACLNDIDLPCLDSALAMDEVLIGTGQGPMILQVLAAELGHVVLDVCSLEDGGDIGALLGEKAEASGHFMAHVARSFADGSFDPEEKSLAIAQLDDVVRCALRLRGAIAEGAG